MFDTGSRHPFLLSPDSGGAGAGSGESGKMVPEHDLLAVKQQLTDLQSQIADLNNKHQNAANESSRERAHRERLEGELAIAKTTLQQLDTIKSDLDAHKKRADDAEATLLQSRRQGLVDKYGLDIEKVKSWDAKRLAEAEEVLGIAHPSAGGNHRPTYDRGGSGGTTTTQSARDKIRAGVEAKFGKS